MSLKFGNTDELVTDELIKQVWHTDIISPVFFLGFSKFWLLGDTATRALLMKGLNSELLRILRLEIALILEEFLHKEFSNHEL